MEVKVRGAIGESPNPAYGYLTMQIMHAWDL